MPELVVSEVLTHVPMLHTSDSLAILGIVLSFAPPAFQGAWLDRHVTATTTAWVTGVMLMAAGVLGHVFRT